MADEKTQTRAFVGVDLQGDHCIYICEIDGDGDSRGFLGEADLENICDKLNSEAYDTGYAMLQKIAAMKADGEVDADADAEEGYYQQTSEDALDTLNSLIRDARAALDMPPVKFHPNSDWWDGHDGAEEDDDGE